MSIYKEHGFKNRKDYLESLYEEYESDTVDALSDLFGPSEDFDGLLVALEDSSY